MTVIGRAGWALVALVVAGCGRSGRATDASGDDDDDQPFAEHTGRFGRHTGYYPSPEPVPFELTMWAQLSVVDGVVVESITHEGSTYRSILVLHFGDPFESTALSCSVVAPLTAGAPGVLDDATVIAPTVDLGPAPVADTDCDEVLQLPAGTDLTTLVTAYPEWSVGIAAALTPAMQDALDQIPTEYQDFYLGAHWWIPILKEPAWETVYAVGTVIEGGALGDPIVRADLDGRATLPDGIYYTDALLSIDAWGLLSRL